MDWYIIKLIITISFQGRHPVIFFSPSCWVWARWRSLCCPGTGGRRTTFPADQLSSRSKHGNRRQNHLLVPVSSSVLSFRTLYLIEQLFASGAGQDGKLQLSIHGCDANIYLPEKTHTLRWRNKSSLCVTGKASRSMQLDERLKFGSLKQKSICCSFDSKSDQKELFLTFFCSTRSIQSQEVGGDYNQKMKPTVYFRFNW